MAKTGPKPKYRVGDRLMANCGWWYEIFDYTNASEIKILWEDGSIESVRSCNIKTGALKPLNYPSVYGVGFVGNGRFLPNTYKIPAGKVPIPRKLYRHWVKLLDRIYNLENKHTSSNMTYKGCAISKEWHNFQNFCEWAIKEPYWQEDDACLDKDLLVMGNKYYSPATCCFIPNIINVFISGSKLSEKGLPRGVNLVNPKTVKSKVGYIARCHFDYKREYLGYFDTPLEAEVVYNKRKSEVAAELCKRYKDSISHEAYKALLAYSDHTDKCVD